MSGCLNKLIPKLILIIVALLLVAAVGGAITEDGNQDAFDTAMEELPFAGPISKVLCNIMKLDKGEELLSANDLITDILKVLIKLKLYEDQTIYMEFRDIKVILRITKNKFTVLLDTEDKNVNSDVDVNVFEEFMKQYDYPIMDIKLQQHTPSGTTGN